MRDWVVGQRVNKILSKGKIDANTVIQLFKEYEQDKLNGVAKEDSEARAVLILGNSSLVSFVLMRKFHFSYSNCDIDEFSVGKMGLIKAIDNFDVNLGAQFSTYAYRVIYNEILMYYRKQGELANTTERDKISLEDCYLEDSKSEILPQYAEALSEQATFIDEVMTEDFMNRLPKYLVHLTPIEQISVVYTFGLYGNDTLRQWEIAKKINVARSSVSKAANNGLNKLKAMLLEEQLLSDEQRVLRYKILRENYPLDKSIINYFDSLKTI